MPTAKQSTTPGGKHVAWALTEDGAVTFNWACNRGAYRARLRPGANIQMEVERGGSWGSLDVDESPVALASLVGAIFADKAEERGDD